MDGHRTHAGAALCDAAASDICVSICPTGAVSAAGSKPVTMAALIVAECRTGAEGLTKKNLGLKDPPFSDHPTVAEVGAAAVDPRQLREAMLPLHRGTYSCGKCPA